MARYIYYIAFVALLIQCSTNYRVMLIIQKAVELAKRLQKEKEEMALKAKNESLETYLATLDPTVIYDIPLILGEF